MSNRGPEEVSTGMLWMAFCSPAVARESYVPAGPETFLSSLFMRAETTSFQIYLSDSAPAW